MSDTQKPVAWAISYDGKTPYKLADYGDCPLLDAEVKRHGGTACKMPLYTTPTDAAARIAELERERDALRSELAEARKDAERLLEALNAMLTHMGMDEDEWNKPTFDQARAAIAATQRKEHIADVSCWCMPSIDYTDPDTGISVYIHKEPQ